MSGWKNTGEEPDDHGDRSERNSLTPEVKKQRTSDYDGTAKTPFFLKLNPVASSFPAVIKQRSLAIKLGFEGRLSNLQISILRALRQEREAGTYFHFAPLIFGIANAIYFAAPSEPVLFVSFSCGAVLAIGALRQQHHATLWLTLCVLALFFAGLSAGKIRTHLVNTNALTYQVTGQVSGIVIEVSQNQRGAPRYLIAPKLIEGVKKSQLPTYIRLSSASKHRRIFPGDQVSGLARLRAISGPAYPGSFDFSFNSWFNGLGGSGFLMGKPTIISAQEVTQVLSFSQQIQISINLLRLSIADRIRTALAGESGDVAVALIIGDRTGIDKNTQQSLRQSGLAHVLAISGMHMALVSLTMVWAVRFLLALNVQLAVNRPIKKWAALAGFITASSYLAISGGAVATQRAWIMISIIMLAAMILRKSITLRGVAIAAMTILALQPESILSPGFQMSFAAVAAIVAAYEWLDGRKTNGHFRPNRVLRFFGTLLFTSLIAGLATSLFAAYHFHRVAPMGVVTNLLAMPLVSIIIMPMALVAMLLMPFGFEQLALVPMGLGIEKVIYVSNFVNQRSLSGVTGQLGASVLPLSFIGMFLLTMLKTRLRLLGVAVLISSTYFWQAPKVPDILLSEDGRAIAILNENSQLALLYPRRNKFVRDIWLRAFSDDQAGELPLPPSNRKQVILDSEKAKQRYNAPVRQSLSALELSDSNASKSKKSTDEQRSKNPSPKKTAQDKSYLLRNGLAKEILEPNCEKDYCITYTRQGAMVYVVFAPKLLSHACDNADILLAPKLRWVNCRGRQPALIIRRGQLEEYGAHAIYLQSVSKQESAKLQLARSNSTVELSSKVAPKSENSLHHRSIKSADNVSAYELTRQTSPKSDEPSTITPRRFSSLNSQATIQIYRIETAITSTRRPWNQHRENRAAYRQD